jgi:hypothetical protein
MIALHLPSYDDELIGKRLLWQIEREIAANQSRDGSFHVTVCRSDSETVATKIVGSIAPGSARVMWARYACRLLNRQVREGGTWIVVWCEPRDRIAWEPTRLLVLHKDSQGDIATGFDCVQPIEEIVGWGQTWFLGRAQEALQAYRAHLHDAGIKPSQMIAEALGQQSANPRASGLSDM